MSPVWISTVIRRLLNHRRRLSRYRRQSKKGLGHGRVLTNNLFAGKLLEDIGRQHYNVAVFSTASPPIQSTRDGRYRSNRYRTKSVLHLVKTSATNAAQRHNQFLSDTVDNTDYGDNASMMAIATTTIGIVCNSQKIGTQGGEAGG